VISRQYLCFAACLQLAAKETTGIEIDQAVIANHLGVVVPIGFDCSALIEQGVKNIRFDPDASVWGIEPVAAEIDRILKRADGLLKCGFESISRFQDWEFEDRLTALTQSGHFPIIGFDYNALYGESGPENRGHCAVVYRVQQMNGHAIVEMYDPGPDPAGFQTVDSYSLYRACRKRHGGIWSIAPLSH
jgi:hypothetical protein